MMNDQRTKMISERIKEARQAAGLSQEELGRRLGLTKVGYGEYERARRLFDTEQIFQLARILGRPVEYFLGLDTELSPDEGRVLALYRQVRANGVSDMAIELLETMAKPRP